MLICPAIEARVAAKELFPWQAPGVLIVRRGFYATGRAIQALSQPWPIIPGRTATETHAIQQEMVDVIAAWQSGAPLVAPDQIKPLKPYQDGVWTLRAAGLAPGTRTFGIVPMRNIFVATGVVPRDILGTPPTPQWTTSTGVVVAMIKKWFPHDPVIAWSRQRRFRTPDLGVICDDF